MFGRNADINWFQQQKIKFNYKRAGHLDHEMLQINVKIKFQILLNSIQIVERSKSYADIKVTF